MAGTRSRGGCWSCRQRRRKCDEMKPECNTCKARGIACGGYELRLVEFQATGAYGGQMVCKTRRGSAPVSTAALGASRTRSRATSSRITFDEPQSSSAQNPPQTHRIPSSETEGPFCWPLNQPPHQPDTLLLDPSQDSTTPALDEGFGNPLQSISPRSQIAEVRGDDRGNLTDGARSQDCGTETSPPFESEGSLDTVLARESCSSFHSELGFPTSQLMAEDSVLSSSHTDWGAFDACIAPESESHFSLIPQGNASWQHMQPATDSFNDFTLSSWTGNRAQHKVPFSFLDSVDPCHRDNKDDKNTSSGGGKGIEVDSLRQRTSPDEPNQLITQPSSQPISNLCDNLWPSLDLDPISTSAPAVADEDSLFDAPSLQRDIAFKSVVETPFDNYLYSHFFNVVAPGLFPVSSSCNPYKLLYGNLATTSQPIRDTILAASALHLSMMGQLPPRVVSSYQDASNASFGNAEKTNMQAETLAANLLLSVLVEAIGTSTDNSILKLKSARALLLNRDNGLSEQRSSSISFLKLQFNWMAAIGRTMLSHSTNSSCVNDLDYIEDSYTVSEREFSEDQDKWFCNLPDYHFFCLLKEATQLYREILRSSSDSASVRLLIPDVADLLLRIKQWYPSPSSACAPYDAFVAEVNEVWRQGLLCFIYADICTLPSSDRRIQECVGRAMTALRSLTWMQSIMWPAFMISVHALANADQQLVEKVLDNMGATVSFATPRTIMKLLRRVWADMKVTGKSRWRTLMVESDTRISLVI